MLHSCGYVPEVPGYYFCSTRRPRAVVQMGLLPDVHRGRAKVKRGFPLCRDGGGVVIRLPQQTAEIPCGLHGSGGVRQRK